jgi:hypothetical protein
MIMATISENLQILKDSTDAIKQAIIDKGGTINGDITTWANAISGIETSGGGGSDNLKIFSFNIDDQPSGSRTRVYNDGMTWGEWVDSIYNTIDSFGVFRKVSDIGPILCNAGEVYNGGILVYASQLISDSIIYSIMQQAG